MQALVIATGVMLLAGGGPGGAGPELVAAAVKAAGKLVQDGKWDQALALVDAAAPVVQGEAALEARLQTARGTVLLAQARRQTGRFDLAEAALEEARRKADAAGDPGARAQARSELGMVPYWNVVLRKQGSFDPANTLFREAEELFRTAKDAPGEGRALFRQGLVAQFSQRPDDAIKLLRRSLALAERAGDKELMVEDHRHLGAAYHMKKDLRRALKHFEQSLAFRRRIGGKLGLAPALQAVADTQYAFTRDANRPAAMLQEALAIATEQNDTAYVASVEMSLARIDSDAGRIEPARQRLQRAIAAARKISDTTTESEAQALLGKLTPDSARP